ncbi:MAG: toll/interleukin-1 receptor domain-containing protein [Myxococcota bacterium]
MSEPPALFISYRRDDTQVVGPLADALERDGKAKVFFDRDLSPGAPFPAQLREQVVNADAILVLMGARWMRRDERGHSALMDDGDWVRQELELGHAHQIPLLPVLVDGAPWPDRDSLPTSLRFLLDLHRIEFNSRGHFSMETTRIWDAVVRAAEERQRRESMAQRRPAAYQDFLTYISEYLTFSAVELDEDQIRMGFVETMYSASYREIVDKCLPAGRITLLEARRGIGKTFLLKRLAAEARSRHPESAANVLHVWRHAPAPTLADADLTSRLATLLIWGITEQGERYNPAEVFGGHWRLFRSLVRIYETSDTLSLQQAEVRLRQTVPEEQGRDVAAFMLDMGSVDYQWTQLRRLLKTNGIRHLNLFIDEFTESVPHAHAHDRFMRMLKALKTELSPGIGCTIVAGIYPRVTSLREFRGSQDGRLLALEYQGDWQGWHREATTFITSQFSAYCQGNDLQTPTESEVVALRNRLFGGKAIKRLSYLSNRSPRQYLNLLQDAVAGADEETSVDVARIERVAADYADRDFRAIPNACERFDTIDVDPQLAQRAFTHVRAWTQYGAEERRARGQAPSLSIEAETSSNQGILSALAMLEYLGLLRVTGDSSPRMTIELSPMHAVPTVLSDGEMDQQGPPYPVAGTLLHGPHHVAVPTPALPSEAQSPRDKSLTDFLRKRLSDRHLGFDEDKLQDLNLSSYTVGQVAVYSPVQDRFRSRKQALVRHTTGALLSNKARKMIEAQLARHLEEHQITIVDDTEPLDAEALLDTPLAELSLSNAVVSKLEKAGHLTVRDLVAFYPERGHYQYNGGPKLERVGLKPAQRKAVAARIKEFIETWNLRYTPAM